MPRDVKENSDYLFPELGHSDFEAVLAEERAAMRENQTDEYEDQEELDKHTTASNVNAGHAYERMRVIRKVNEGTAAQAEGGRTRPFGHDDGNLEKEGDGGIAGPGDGLVGADVHTPVGGSVRSVRRKKDKARLVRMVKAVRRPGDYDMFVVEKQFTGAPRDRRFVVAGYASPVVVDLEGHRIGHETLKADLPRFLADDGRYANVNIMHTNVTIGRVLPEFTAADGKTYRTQVDDVGLFAVAEVRTDEAAPAVCAQVIDDIEAGVLKSFSISGNASNPRFICEGDRCFYDIGELQLLELTLCEEGVNQDAKFDIIAKALKTGEYFGMRIIKRRVDKGVPAGRPWMDDELLDAAHFFAELVRSGERPQRAYKRAGERYPRVEMSTSLFTANQDFEWFWLNVARFEGMEIPDWPIGNKTRWTIRSWVGEFTDGLRSLIEG